MNRAGLNKENSSSSNGNPEQGRNSCFSSSNRENESELTQIKKFQDTITALTQKLESAEQKNSNLENICQGKSRELKNLQNQFAILEKREAKQAEEILELKKNISNLESMSEPLVEMRKLMESVSSMESSMRVDLATPCHGEDIKKRFDSFKKLVVEKLGAFKKVQLELEQVVRGRLAKESGPDPTPHPAPRPLPTLLPSPASMDNFGQSASGNAMNLRPRKSPPPVMVSVQQCVSSPAVIPAPPSSVPSRSSPRSGSSRGHQSYPPSQPTNASVQPTLNLTSAGSSIRMERDGLGSPYHISLHSDHNITLPECRRCEKIFISWRALKKHNDETLICRSQPSQSLSALRGGGIQHGIVSHDKSTDGFFCLCSRNLERSRFCFTKHYLYYNAECLFYCWFCDKRFLYNCELQSHLKTKMHAANLLSYPVNCSTVQRGRTRSRM